MPRPDSIVVAGLQVALRTAESRDDRVRRVISEVASGPAADLVVLPELWDVGYFAFDEYEAAASTPESGTAQAVAETAAARGVAVVCGSVVERNGGRLYNTVVVAGPDGRLAGTYRKAHLFANGSREAELLTPGPGPVAIDVGSIRIGLATCFDLRFPEHFAALRRFRADLLVVPAAWPAARRSHWEVLTRARAIDVQTPIVAVNGAGCSHGTALAGRSAIFGARGEAIAEAGPDGEAWVVGVVSFEDAERWRREFPLEDAVIVA